MLKQSPIEAGSQVYWLRKIDPKLVYVAKLSAKVLQVIEDQAVIEIDVDVIVNSPKETYKVPLSELENKRWEIDTEKVNANILNKFNKAEKVTDLQSYDGYFFDPYDEEKHCYCSVEEYLEDCENEEIEPSEFLWLSKPIEFKDYARYTADLFWDGLCEDLHEDFIPVGLDELGEAIYEFYKANLNHGCVKPDYSKAYVIKGL